VASRHDLSAGIEDRGRMIARKRVIRSGLSDTSRRYIVAAYLGGLALRAGGGKSHHTSASVAIAPAGLSPGSLQVPSTM
jgi:hypothetical protein